MNALTEREVDVLRAYARVGDMRQAARDLRLSYSHAKNVIHKAYGKLGVTGAVSAYRELGWLVLPFLRPARVPMRSRWGTARVGLR